jgi:hypothetical protein
MTPTTKSGQMEDSVEHDPQRASQTSRDGHSADREDHGVKVKIHA